MTPLESSKRPVICPEAAKSGDDHPRLLLVDLIGFSLLFASVFPDASATPAGSALRPSTAQPPASALCPFRIEYICHLRCAKRPRKQTHSPAPAARQNQRRCGFGTFNGRANQPQHRHFNDQETHQQNDDAQRMGYQRPEVDRHPDADEKQPQQQSFKRLDIAFQRVTVFGACQ